MEAAQARLSLHLSKCHIDGNHMSQLSYYESKLSKYHVDREDSDPTDIMLRLIGVFL